MHFYLIIYLYTYHILLFMAGKTRSLWSPRYTR